MTTQLNAKHTLGPWIYSQNSCGSCLEVCDSDGMPVAAITPQMDDTENANARLIAACPELLDALREACDMVDLLGRECADRVWDGQRGHAVTADKFRAALAKAEGRE